MSKHEQEEPPAAAVTPPRPSEMGFWRLRRFVLLASVSVLLVPLSVMVLFGYQFDKAIRSDAMKPIARLTSHIQQSLESYFDERLSILSYTVQERSLDSLRDPDQLEEVLGRIRTAFPAGAFVDLGLIDSDGTQVAYTGRFHLEGRNYVDQEWYRDVKRKGTCVSDVFLGYRDLAHFAVAIEFGDLAAQSPFGSSWPPRRPPPEATSSW